MIKKIIRIFLLVLCGLLLIYLVASGIYISNYKSADANAVEAFQNPADGVTAIDENGRMIFAPEGGTDVAVIFYPGATVRYEAYAPLAEKLAENGIMCILVDVPLNMAVLNADAAEDIKDDYPQITQWYIGGHSMGGLAAENCAADHDGEYDGLIMLASRIRLDFSESDMPVLLVSATNDAICSPERLEKSDTPAPKEFTHVVIEGGCHGYFGSYGDQPYDGIPDISWEDQQEQTVDAIVEWISEL